MSSDGRNTHVNAKPEPILRHWQAATIVAQAAARGAPENRIRATIGSNVSGGSATPLRASVYLTPILIEIQHYDRATVPRGTHSPIFWMRAPVRQRRNTQLSRRRHGATIFQFQWVGSNVAKLSLRDAILLIGLAFGPLREFVLYICINRLLRQVGTASETAERSFGTTRSATRPNKIGVGARQSARQIKG